MRKPEAKKLTSERLQQFGFAYAPPLTISAAVNNKVFDTLQHAPKTVEQVTKETGGSPPRIAHNHGCAGWLGTAEEGSAIEILPDAREPCISDQRKTRHA